MKIRPLSQIGQTILREKIESQPNFQEIDEVQLLPQLWTYVFIIWSRSKSLSLNYQRQETYYEKLYVSLARLTLRTNLHVKSKRRQLA